MAMATTGIGAASAEQPAASGSARATKPLLITRRIGASGEALPVIGLGTWQTFDVGAGAAERAPLQEVMRAFVDEGGRLVDSSPMYGRAEGVVGDVAQQLGVQQELFLATKVWTSGKASGVQQMRASMQKLRSERLDLMQVHNLLDVDAHLDTLAGWQKEGLVRYVGVTHYTASAHDEVARVVAKHRVDFVQINYSVAERDAERRLLPMLQERGIAVIANRPFAEGAVFKRLGKQPVPSWAAEIDCDSWAQLMLKFVVSHPAVTVVIPATSKVKHLRDNMKAAYGRLPDEAMRARIAAATSF